MSFNKKAAVFYYRHRKIILICINLVSVILLVIGLAVTKRVSRGGEYRTKEDLAIYIHKYHELPKNFITLYSRDNAARCNESTKRCIIGGDSFWNDGQFREYGIRSDQCFQIVDIPDEDYTVYNRGTKRMVYTINTYKVRLFYSEDNCLTFEEIRLSDIQKARNIFRGSGDLILSNQEDRYYKATVINQIKFERVVRQNHSVVVTFKLQPHAYELKDNTITLTTSPYILTNETNATAQPEITIYGTGTATLIIGNETVHIKNINNHIILDYELQEAYRITNGSPSNANTDVNCDYSEIQIGTTKIEWSGSGITRIKINPRWRYL